MSKFKVGDKVISKESCNRTFATMIKSGRILTIERITSEINEVGELRYYLYFEEKGRTLGFIETEFELFNQLNTKLGDLW